jgi:hypothetical protein
MKLSPPFKKRISSLLLRSGGFHFPEKNNTCQREIG